MHHLNTQFPDSNNTHINTQFPYGILNSQHSPLGWSYNLSCSRR
ncbi:hypothetical protein M6B38_417360 [Iris pallida]|uniref:Uncharacterized protein n=1 Tax=Iris pallida TaxID=29817 RepID=A0AAX6FII0_IRIPA|nr:hypothetical protein M6B38_417360 [Iris pallida]